jgi:hypothetical protein
VKDALVNINAARAVMQSYPQSDYTECAELIARLYRYMRRFEDCHELAQSYYSLNSLTEENSSFWATDLDALSQMNKTAELNKLLDAIQTAQEKKTVSIQTTGAVIVRLANSLKARDRVIEAQNVLVRFLGEAPF